MRLFQAACKAHVDYVVAASNGYGCDRHFLGLSMCLEKGESDPFFKDPVFNSSRNFRLSTSNLFPGKHLLGTGFGTMVCSFKVFGKVYTEYSFMMVTA